MPQVPIYNQNQVNVSRTAAQYEQVNASAKAFGVSGYEAVGDGLDTISKALRLEQERMNKAVLLEKATALDKWEEFALYDPKEGYYSKSGKAAMGQSGKILEDFDKIVNEITASLNDESLKNRLNSIARKKRESIFKNVSIHDIRETRNWRESVKEVALDTQLNKAVLGRNNPEAVDTAIQNAVTIIRSNAMDTGEDETITQAKTDKAVSTMHINVLDAMLTDDNVQAKDYFEKHKDQIEGTKQPKLLEVINANTLKHNSQKKTDEIIGLGLSEPKALKRARGIEDAELRDEVIDRLKVRYTEQRRFENEAKQKREEQAWKQLESNPNYGNIPSDVDAATRLSMRRFVKSLSSGGSSSARGKTDPDVYLGLYDMSIYEPEKFMDMDLMKYRGYLSNSDFKQFYEKQDKVFSSETKKQVLATAKRLNLSSDDEKEFKTLGEDLITEYKRQYKKNPSTEEIKKFAELL